MRKAAEASHGRSGGASGALSPETPASPAATTAASSATTIGRYIARFRYEQPLPREARSSVPKEDFWWKSGGASPSHRRARIHQRSPHDGESAKREGGGSDDGGGLSSLAMSGSMSGSANSVKSGYERYIPELHHHHHHHEEQQQRIASQYEYNDALVSVTIDKHHPPVAGVRSSGGDAGGGGDALLLSSASWSSLPSGLEPPSSSQESIPRALRTPPTRASWETPGHSDHFAAYMHSEAAAVALEGQNDEDDGVEGHDEKSKVEDAESVIERVRKRLGWSSSDDDSDSLSSFRKYDAPSSLSPVSPMLTMQWRRRPQQRDYLPELPLPSSIPASGRLSGGDDGDDEILSGSLRVVNASHEPTQVKPLQLALSELRSENQVQVQGQRHFDMGVLTPRATDSYSVPSSGDTKEDAEKNIENGSSLDQLAGFGLQASLNAGDAAATDIQRLCGREEIAQSEPYSQDHDTGGDTTSGDDVDCTEAFTSGEDALEEHGKDASEFRPGDQTVAVFGPLESAESPVIPVWRRESNASFSSGSATSPSFPPRALASSPSSSSVSGPRFSSQSSQSSVTAETAKTLDGLVSLVVQSWSNDFFFGGENDGKHQDDDAQEASEFDERNPTEDGDDHGEETTGDLAGQESMQSSHVSSARDIGFPPQQCKEEIASESPERPPLRHEPPVAASLSVDFNALLPAAAAEKGGNANIVKVDPAAASESYDSEKEDENADDEDDDEIVRLLLSRVALYEEALRRLERKDR